MRLLLAKRISMKLLIIISLLIVGCSGPTQPQSGLPQEIEIIEVSKPSQYWISPLGDVFSVSPKWQRGLPILREMISICAAGAMAAVIILEWD